MVSQESESYTGSLVDEGLNRPWGVRVRGEESVRSDGQQERSKRRQPIWYSHKALLHTTRHARGRKKAAKEKKGGVEEKSGGGVSERGLHTEFPVHEAVTLL